MDKLPFEYKLVQLLHRWRHILEAHADWDNGKAVTLKVCDQLRSIPSIGCDFLDIVHGVQLVDRFPHEIVVHHIALGDMEQPHALPYIVRNMVSPHSKVKCFSRQPEVGYNDVFIIFVQRRKHQHKCRDIRCAGQVKSRIALPSSELFKVDWKITPVVDMLRNPCHRTAYPLIQTKLTEYVFFRWVCQCLAVSVTHSVDGDSVSERGVCLVPRLLGIPVVAIIKSVDHGIKGRINTPSFEDVFGFRVILVADGISVRSCRGDKEVQRLSTGIAGALCENIHKAAVRLVVPN